MQSIIWLIGSAGHVLSRFTPKLQPIRGATNNQSCGHCGGKDLGLKRE